MSLFLRESYGEFMDYPETSIKFSGRGDVWQMWNEMRNKHRILIIQFRHSESDWSRGIPEFVHLEKNDPLGVVNIAGRLFCRVK